MPLLSMRQVRNLKGKIVLLRVDFNVPIKKGRVMDDSRIVASLPTIEFLHKKGAKVILVTHIGRPEGKVMKELSVKPVVKRLGELLHCYIVTLSNCVGENIEKKVKNMKSGDIVMLENVRFHPGEEKNDPAFAKELASLADIFVLDGFAVAHRASASVVGVAKYIPSYAGLLLEREVMGLDLVMKRPKKPFVLILGGAKSETKIPVLKFLLPKADTVLIGGGFVNTYLVAKGYGIGDSLVDNDLVDQALLYCKKKKVVKPIDLTVGTKDGKRHRVVEIGNIPHEICKKGEGIFDIGPKSIALFETHTKKAKTVVWNGAMGYFEQTPYNTGTQAIARVVALQSQGKAYGVIGGGETVQVVEQLHLTKHIDLMSTGGGAMLEYLSGKTLPGIAALWKK